VFAESEVSNDSIAAPSAADEAIIEPQRTRKIQLDLNGEPDISLSDLASVRETTPQSADDLALVKKTEALKQQLRLEALEVEPTPVAQSRELTVDEIPAYVQRQLASLSVDSLPQQSRAFEIAKRVVDLAIAIPSLIVSLPIIGLIALAIRLESDGPAVFRQPRVGRNGEVFRFCKFRTMYVDAKERFPELYNYNFDSSELGDRFYKLPNDPRNTKLGALLRRTSLDELPNLFNVIRGNTSIVGPRPELPEMIQHYRPEQLVKFAVKPGLTCLAASTGRNTLTIDQQIRADVEYSERQSVGLDIRIVFDTAKMIVAMIGAH
jgi:lipopolysaccharide/colanic/teichoic acid biosynthesis glycosyltransferase